MTFFDAALKMGAKHFVNTSHENWVEEAGVDYDVIVSTRASLAALDCRSTK